MLGFQSQMAMIWAYKYQPKTLSEISSTRDHKHSSAKLTSLLTNKEELPHLCLHGPPGAGKTTHIQAFLKDLFLTMIYQQKKENILL